MAVSVHIPTKLMNAQAQLIGNQTVTFSDTSAGHFVCGIVTAGSGIPSTTSTGVQFIADITATNTELSYAGYARQSLTGIAVSYDATTGVVDWTFNNIVFSQQAADPGTGRYGFIGYKGVGAGDSTFPVVTVIDFGQTVSTVNGALTLQPAAGGLIQFTGGG